MSTGFNYDTREIIFGLKSKLGRRDDEITALNERIAVLENLVQSTSDDRDGYMERCTQLEGERDRARRVAVSLEQELYAAEHARCFTAGDSSEYLPLLAKCDECAEKESMA